MNERTETLLKTFQPKLAIVVYGSALDKDYYLESHDIDEKGKLMAGKPLLQETIQEIVDVFFDEHQNTSQVEGFIPDNVLYYAKQPGGYYDLMWWQPAQLKQIFFASVLKIPSGQTNVPALLYFVSRKQLTVLAMKQDQRPNEKTVLYRAPFHNISDDGNVCLGNATVKKPQQTYTSLIKYWEDLFWLSEFSHLNGAANPTKTDLSILWRKFIADRMMKWSDTDELKISKIKINKLIE